LSQKWNWTKLGIVLMKCFDEIFWATRTIKKLNKPATEMPNQGYKDEVCDATEVQSRIFGW
jgi:hypothetical protein